MSDSSDDEVCLAPISNFTLNVNNVQMNLLPQQSRDKYIKQYEMLNTWREAKGADTFSEKVLLAYFMEISETKKSSTLWSIYSMLKATLKMKEDLHIETFPTLVAFIKNVSAGYQPKRSKVFTASEIEEFLNKAPDAIYLAAKVSFTAQGMTIPVFTPLNEDLSINFDEFPAYTKYVVDNGFKNVLVGGTTGEHVTLSVTDRKKIIDAWVTAGQAAGLHIMVHVGGMSCADVRHLAAYCQKVGANSLLTLPELYFKPTTVDELVSYISIVANAAPKLPVLYYHTPYRTNVVVNMSAFIKTATAKIPNFKGVKCSAKCMDEATQMLRSVSGDQEILMGNETVLAAASFLGIKSSTCTTFNIFPQLNKSLLDAVAKNDVAKARALQEKLNLAIEAHLAEGPWVASLKAGMEIVTGIKVGPPNLPQQPISEEGKLRIKGKLKALGLLQ